MRVPWHPRIAALWRELEARTPADHRNPQLPLLGQSWVRALRVFARRENVPLLPCAKCGEPAVTEAMGDHSDVLYRELLDTVTWYASGTNDPTQIAAWGELGIPLGTAATLRGKDGKRNVLSQSAIRAHIAHDRDLFCDSGAFGELTSGVPMGDEAWERVFAVYDQLAVLGPRLTVVAPDKIGDAETTIARLIRYRDRIVALHARGVRVMCVVHASYIGDTYSDVLQQIKEVLGWTPVVGIPSNAVPFSDEEMVEVLRDHPDVLAVHLLGLGMNRTKKKNGVSYPSRIAALRSLGRPLVVTCDSARIKTMVGEGRPLTMAQREERELMEEHRWGGTEGTLDYTMMISDPSSWMTYAAKERVAARLPEEHRAAWMLDPSAFYESSCSGDEEARAEYGWLCYDLDVLLDEEWQRTFWRGVDIGGEHVGGAAAEARKRAARRVIK